MSLSLNDSNQLILYMWIVVTVYHSLHTIHSIYVDSCYSVSVFIPYILYMWIVVTVYQSSYQSFYIQSSATNACHYNANASLMRSILGSQTTCPHNHPRVAQLSSAHGLKVWNHRCLIGHSCNDTPLFPYKWNKTKVSHLLVMSIQSIPYWSSIKHTDYSSPVLRECHHQANMAARCLDVENNPGSNQVNIRYTQ